MKIDDVRKLSPFDRLVYWVTERESIRLKKEAGKPWPFTDDEILQRFRFTNVRRMDDKVSRWLLENWYKPFAWFPMLEVVALARFVNKIESLDSITKLVFRTSGTDWAGVKARLRSLQEAGPVFSTAYMVRGNTATSPDKIGTVVDEYIGALRAVKIVLDTDSMERTHAKVVAVYGFGSFMAGQLVADLRWAVEGGWADRDSWAPLGPGSRRGMNRIWGRDKDAPTTQERFGEDLEEMMVRGRKKLPADLTDRLEAMDWQNICCEYDKYTRVLTGEGRPKQKYKPGVTG